MTQDDRLDLGKPARLLREAAVRAVGELADAAARHELLLDGRPIEAGHQTGRWARPHQLAEDVRVEQVHEASRRN